jgi:hypothetical protein
MLVGATLPAGAQPAPIEIGRYITNQIVFHFDEPLPLAVPPSSLPQHPGYALENLSIESLREMNKREQFPLAPESDIRLMLVAIDPGLSLLHSGAPVSPGQEIVLRAPFLEITPLWVIHPGPPGAVFHATLRARDDAGISAQSDPFVVSFVTVPSPGAATVLGLGTWLATHRRRERLD